MTKILNTEYLLAIVLSKKDWVSFSELHTLRETIEKELPILIALHGSSIDFALEHYPEVFERWGHGIIRAPKAKQYLEEPYLSAEFLNATTDEINQKVMGIIDKHNP
jgi:hypothetical protein